MIPNAIVWKQPAYSSGRCLREKRRTLRKDSSFGTHVAQLTRRDNPARVAIEAVAAVSQSIGMNVSDYGLLPLRLRRFRPARMASAQAFLCSGLAFCHRRARPSASFVF